MSRANRRGPWVAEEDATLLSLVASRGPNNWVHISQHMHFRSPKQCRERYHQNLKASLNHNPISGQEGEAIEEMVNEMGKKWAEIARRLGNRSDNAVKNWWNGSQNRKKRNVPHHGSSSKTLTNRTPPLPAARSNGRHRSDNVDPAMQRHPDWQNVERGTSGLGYLRTEQSHAAERGDICGPSRSHVYHRQPNSPRLPLPYPRSERVRRSSPPRSLVHVPTHEVGPLLPSLGQITTGQAGRPSTIPTLQPPLSAASIDGAPSLVSDHNSTYSISPKTWPSPRPELPSIWDTGRRRWPDSNYGDRRGSAPALSQQISLPSPGDEGYVSAFTPSAGSENKCLVPPPGARPESLDGERRSVHRHCLSTPSSCTSPMFDRSDRVQDLASGPRDSRMTFSRLLN